MLFIFSRHQLEDDESKINHKMHLQVRRMMSEKRQKKKVIKTSPGEPDIQVSGMFCQLSQSYNQRCTGWGWLLRGGADYWGQQAAAGPESSRDAERGRGGSATSLLSAWTQIQIQRSDSKQSVRWEVALITKLIISREVPLEPGALPNISVLCDVLPGQDITQPGYLS